MSVVALVIAPSITPNGLFVSKSQAKAHEIGINETTVNSSNTNNTKTITKQVNVEIIEDNAVVTIETTTIDKNGKESKNIEKLTGIKAKEYLATHKK